VSWSTSHPSRFNPWERAPSTHWTGGWVDPKAGLDDMEKRKFLILPGLELRPLGCPARSQSLYRLCYPSLKIIKSHIILKNNFLCVCVSKFSSHMLFQNNETCAVHIPQTHGEQNRRHINFTGTTTLMKKFLEISIQGLCHNSGSSLG
jgi:hypothetical protein